MLNFIHALIVTPFEQEILGSDRGNWHKISQQDFAVHALYCANTQEFIYFGDNLKENTLADIRQFLINLRKVGVTYRLDRRIISLANGEDEKCKTTVAQYF